MAEQDVIAHRLATLLQEVEESDRELADAKAHHKMRTTLLYNQIATLKCDILFGQQALPLEQPKVQNIKQN